MGMRRAVLDMVLIFANNPILTINLQKIIINYKFLCYSKEENKNLKVGLTMKKHLLTMNILNILI